MAYLHLGGVTTLVSVSGKTSDAGGPGSTATAGDWFQVHPKINVKDIGFTCKLTGSSAVSTATATVSIEASNDGTNAASTDLLTFSGITLTTNTVVLSGTIMSSFAGHYGYIRANVTSLTTSTAGSTSMNAPLVVVAAGTMFRAN